MDQRKKILLMVDWFDPAYKAGGPIRSAVNFSQHMRADFDIYVFTGDRDLHQTEPLNGIHTNQWIDYTENVKVWYTNPRTQSATSVKSIIESIQPDFIYLNSVFSTVFTIFPFYLRLRGTAKSAKIVLSPRGMLRSSALRFKSLKKKIFLAALKLTGLPAKIRFIATDGEEASDINRLFGKQEVWIASNFGAAIIPYVAPIPKSSGEITMIFVGRIHPIKNLHFLLDTLRFIKGKVILTIVGVLEDTNYWDQCKVIINSLSKDVKVEFRGDLPYNQLGNLISNHHIFALPTQGENFGHAIFESLSHGKPVLISDQTPWRDLEEVKAGWDLALSQPEAFTKAIQRAIDWNQQEYNLWSQSAWDKASSATNFSDLKEQYKKIFA